MTLLVSSNSLGSSQEPFRSSFIQIEKTRYHLLEAGSSNKPKILFLHGFPESSYAWAKQLVYFSKNYHTIAVDLKGYGLSSKPQEVTEYSSEVLSNELIALIKNISNQEKIVLVGHDWGAALSWIVAAKAPELIRRLVIINGAHPILYFREYYNNESQFLASDYIRKIREDIFNYTHYSQNEFKEFQEILFNNKIGEAKLFFNQDVKLHYLQLWKDRLSFEATLNYYKAMQMPPSLLFNPILPAHKNPIFSSMHIRVPTLVLWGEKDIYLVKNVNRGLNGFVKNLQTVTFPNNSHWIVHENPSGVSRQIEMFLKKGL